MAKDKENNLNSNNINNNNIIGSQQSNDNTNNFSKISFWKYTHEKFISEVEIQYQIIDVCYNPKNCMELILCGKGFLRLWNVFINDNSLKEHPQRFLKGKQEKEKTFIKGVFFVNKAFMFIAATQENNLYVFEGYKLIYSMNLSFEKETYDLNIDKILSSVEEEYEGENTNQTNSNILLKDDENISEGKVNHSQNNNNNNSNNDISLEVKGKISNENSKVNSSNNEMINKSKSSSSEGKEKITTSQNGPSINPLKTFFLLNNKNVIFSSSNQAITYIYKLEKEMKKDVTYEKNQINTDEYLKFNIARNIKKIINVICNNKGSKILYMCELENDFEGKNNNENRVSFYLFKRKGNDLKFICEVFKEFFYKDRIKSFDFCERKKLIYTITHSDWLRAFDNNNYTFFTKHKFNDGNFSINNITSSPNNNLFGISTKTKFTLYVVLKDSINKFCEFTIRNPYAKYSNKGDMICISGESKLNSRFYSLYFIEAFNFQTIHTIDFLPHQVKKILWLDNDKYILVMLGNYSIIGWTFDLDSITINTYMRLKEYEPKRIGEYYLKQFLDHNNHNNSIYCDFDYDVKNDYLLVSHHNNCKVIYKKIFENYIYILNQFNNVI